MTYIASPAMGLPVVYMVDDEERVRTAFSWLLRSRRRLSEVFANAEEFTSMLSLQTLPWPRSPSCLVLDVRMPGDNGTVLFSRLADRGFLRVLPVIFLTGHGDVFSAVDAMKRGAFDFIEKPFADTMLLDRIEAALKLSEDSILVRDAGIVMQARLAKLTDREIAVMQRTVEGRTSQSIADELGFSLRTVEIDRARLFEKMQVQSAVELANMFHSRAQ